METKQLTQEDLKNLEAIFMYARKLVVANENELVAVISFKQSLFEKLNLIIERESSVKEPSKE